MVTRNPAVNVAERVAEGGRVLAPEANATQTKWILKNRNVVPELLLTGVSDRNVVPELLAWQLQRDYVAVAEGV